MATVTQHSALSAQRLEQVASDPRLHVAIRPMTLADIGQVTVMDRMAFPNPWPSHTYEYEINDNERARMFVLEPGDAPPPPASNGHRRSWWEKLLGIGYSNGRHNHARLIGFSGMWHIADEAHISTIAVHPEWRGRRLGELLVWAMARQAVRQGAAQITLEVRVNNAIAQKLYKKYGFEVMGLRKGYYRDNHEDAFMMSVQNIDDAYREKLIGLGKELARKVRVTDHW